MSSTQQVRKENNNTYISLGYNKYLYIIWLESLSSNVTGIHTYIYFGFTR